MASKTIDYLINIKGNAAKKAAELGTEIGTATKKMDRMTESAQDAGGKLASLGGVIGGIPIPGFEKLGRAVTAAGDSFEGLTHPIGMVTIALGGSIAIYAAAGAGLVALTMHAKAWHDELVEIGAAGDLLTPSQIGAINEADRSIAALAASTKRLGVLLGAELSPALNTVALGLLTAAGYAEDLIKFLSEHERLVPIVGNLFTGSLYGPVMDLADAFDKAGLNSKALGIEWGSLTKRGEALVKTVTKLTGDEKIDIYGPSQPEERGGKGGKAIDPRIAEAIDRLERTIQPLPETLSSAIVPAIESIPDGFADLEIKIDPPSLQPMIDAMDRMNEAASAAIMNATGSTEGLVRAIPVIGNMVADIGTAMLNLPSLVNGLRKDLIRGPEKLGKAFQGTMENAIPKLIESLPQIFENFWTKFIPAVARGIVLGIPKILAAFARMIADQIKKVFAFLKGGEDRNILTGKREKWLGTSFKRGEFSIFGIGNKKSDSLKEEFASGGFVSRTGMALVHAGERIIPTSGADTGATRARRSLMGGGMSIGTVNVTVKADNPHDFIRQLRRHLGTLGSGATLTPFS